MPAVPRRLASVFFVLLALALSVPALAAQGGSPANLFRATETLPVFTHINAGGNLLVSTPPNGRPTVVLFLRRAQAESFLAGVKAQNATVASQLRLDSPTLSDVLRQRPAAGGYEITFVPDPEQVLAANDELRRQGKPAVQGTPVFLLRSDALGYVTITVNGHQVIPAFLGFGEVLALRQQTQAQVGTPATLAIEVTSLEGLLTALQGAPSPFFNNVLLQPAGGATAELVR